MIIQFCGMSGSGKTTLAYGVKSILQAQCVRIEVIDGDEYRRMLCPDLGFSRQDRNQNIRRLAFVASRMSQHNIVSIICAINPYEEIRQEIHAKYQHVKTVFVDCSLEELIKRDTKGLYKKALLPDDHPDKIHNLTGINDPFERPENPDLIVRSDAEAIESSVQKLSGFIIANLQ